MSAFVSMAKNKKEPAAGIAPPVPSAFPDQRKRDVVPPPVRRVAATTPKRETTPSPPPEAEEEEAEGEWGEILYDYESEVSRQVPRLSRSAHSCPLNRIPTTSK